MFSECLLLMCLLTVCLSLICLQIVFVLLTCVCVFVFTEGAGQCLEQRSRGCHGGEAAHEGSIRWNIDHGEHHYTDGNKMIIYSFYET